MPSIFTPLSKIPRGVVPTLSSKVLHRTSASRLVFPEFTTKTVPSTFVLNIAASVTAITGGLSNITISNSFVNLSIKFSIALDANSSDGFGGRIPLQMMNKFSLKVGLTI